MNKKQGIPRSKLKDLALDKIIERLEIWMGNRGNPEDQVVTYADLVAAKLGKIGRGGTLQPGDGVGIPTTSVGVLSNLTANGAFQNIILSWEGINQAAYSYTEIWRSEDDNLGNAVLVGSTPAAVYADPVSQYKDFYYWVRAVSTSGNPGPYNATSGVTAKIAADYEVVRDYLTATDWQPNTAYNPLVSVVPTTEVELEGVAIRLLAIGPGTSGATEPDWATELTAIDDTVVDGTVTWRAVEAGKIPFYIDPATGLVVIDGAAMRNASIDSAKIGSLSADKIFAASGTIAEALIGDAEITNAMISNIIQSNNYVADEAGWIIHKNGTAEFNNITARGRIEADSGYIAQSVQIGGTAYDLAEVIALAESADTSIFENWIRPGTTLINGNRIFTGDAYVDTLQIQGQAVTFPRGTASYSNTRASNTGTNVLSLSVSTTGAPIIVMGFLACSGGTSNSPFSTVQASIRRGGTTIFGPVPIVSSRAVGFNEAGTVHSITGSGGFHAYLSSSASGTYYLHVEGENVTVSERSLVVLEAKR